MYAKYIKRIIDFILSFIAVIVFSPLLLVIAVLVKINLGAPVIFKQERIGLNEKIFTMYKFRTMNDKRDKNGELLPDIYRQTRLGDFLRSTSLDELPELINILKGDIAIVGPRPLLVSYLPYYTEEERLRHSVRGGLTVPEVVYGDVAPTWEEQFSYEVDYTKNISFLLDIKIIWNTVKIIFKRVENDYGSQVRNPLNVERSDWVRK
ncbi:MAG: sugar transferase [Dorea sp.]|jgi:Sugar transferases involved in lipopolysaccharide synthesis|uniref:sugar transferase n=1 Tax=Sporofaciens musculi TaxID=2681861 RepID=UPI0021719B7D|nr:sugar transferase [Sporofaciens musculi]MCI9422057.1 sugar transferase [Dorea sp.]